MTRLLHSLLAQYNHPFLSGDPVYFVHQYTNPRDQEIVALISALLAFGNVKSIHASIKKVLDLMGPCPAQFLSEFDPEAQKSLFEKLGHRWVRGQDLLLLFTVIQKILKEYSTLEDFFLQGYRDQDPDISNVLHHFSKNALNLAGTKKHSRGFRYFFPSPQGGSPCKRLVLFLRWMIRPADGIDLGLWKKIPASKLIIPLDTHIYSFAQKFRLSRYKNANWKVASEVTAFLRTIDPKDPVRFDFSICHYGMEVGW